MHYQKSVALVVLVLNLLMLVGLNQPALAQPQITNTPVRVVLPTLVEQATNIVLLTATPTFTPTPEPPSVLLQANAPLSDIDVRDYPESGAYLGSLENGQQYAVYAQYYSWLQFEYPAAPSGRAWIYRPLVQIIGDEASIPFIDPNNLVTQSPSDNETATAISLFLTPGYADTVTAQARIVALPTQLSTPQNSEFAPTFTPPSDIVARNRPQPTPSSGTNVEIVSNLIQSFSIPPIAPIATLAVFGLLGLWVSSWRK